MSMIAPAAAQPLDPRAVLSHPDALYEVIDGRVVELPPMGMYASLIATRLTEWLSAFVRERGLGLVISEGLFVLDRTGNRRRPDVSFVSRGRIEAGPALPEEGDWEMSPDLAIEVISPNDTDRDVHRKLREYFGSNVRRVWHVRPEERQVYDYEAPNRVRILGPGEEIDGGAMLPGFRLSIDDLFRWPA